MLVGVFTSPVTRLPLRRIWADTPAPNDQWFCRGSIAGAAAFVIGRPLRSQKTSEVWAAVPMGDGRLCRRAATGGRLSGERDSGQRVPRDADRGAGGVVAGAGGVGMGVRSTADSRSTDLYPVMEVCHSATDTYNLGHN